jgi:t-SNARE complex subunit (syntaxin)
LNVPHTDDVKETFGSMIDTVVEQEAEIKVINNNLETVVEDTGETYEEKMILMLRRMRMGRIIMVMMMMLMRRR